MAQINSDSK